MIQKRVRGVVLAQYDCLPGIPDGGEANHARLIYTGLGGVHDVCMHRAGVQSIGAAIV